MTHDESELDTCPFCKKQYLAMLIKRRSYVVKMGHIGRVTSEQPMCEICFNLVKGNENLK